MRRFVFVSTIGAVDRAPADAGTAPLDEDAPLHPSSDYGRSKGRAEQLVRESGLPFAIVRPALVVGGDMRPDSHFAVFTRAAVRRAPLARFAWPGRFSGVHVDDLPAALELCTPRPPPARVSAPARRSPSEKEGPTPNLPPPPRPASAPRTSWRYRFPAASLPALPLLSPPPSHGRLVALGRWLGLGLVAGLPAWRARPSDQLLALARHDDATHLLDRFDSRLAPPGRLLEREFDWDSVRFRRRNCSSVPPTAP